MIMSAEEKVQKFIVSYDGPSMKKSHSINIEDLAPSLLALDKVFQFSNTFLNGPYNKTHLKITGQKKGSFEVILDLVQVLPEIESLIEDYPPSKLLNTIFGMSGLFVLIKNFKKDKIKNLNVSQPIINIYNNSSVIKKETKNFLKPLTKEGIEEIRFFDNNKSELSSINKKEAWDFLNQSNEEVNKSKNIFEKYYYIKALTFEKGKWKLYDSDTTITALIEDEEFIQKVEKGFVAFSSGDILKCRVREEQKEVNGKLKSSYFIEEVLHHRSSQATAQISLFDKK